MNWEKVVFIVWCSIRYLLVVAIIGVYLGLLIGHAIY